MQLPSWQSQLKSTIRDVATLLTLVEVEEQDLPWPVLTDSQFQLRAPTSFIDRIEKGNPRDPLLLQILPFAVEQEIVPGFSHDPLAEAEATVVPGLLHKYHGRVLLVTTEACGIHCRYCFRRAFPYSEHRHSDSSWGQTIDYISNDNSISEVILSGGDPLSLADKELSWRIQELAAITHIKTIRIHSRLAAILPERFTPELVSILTQSQCSVVLVLHANHGNELASSKLRKPLSQLRQAGVHLLNQSVLLKGVNDSVKVLKELSHKLFELGVLPYYLHLLDQVEGVHHFDVPQAQAVAIYQGLQASVSGYLLPKLVKEIPGRLSKTII
jgi:EF-P beta-lysylation protein EpmB